MLNKLIKLRRTVHEDLVVIDSQFPQKEPFAFRNSEINEYFKKIKNFSSFTMHPMLPASDSWFKHGYGVSIKEFKENKQGYTRHYPRANRRIQYLQPEKAYAFKLAYSFFLAETFVLLPFYEKYKIPFVFVLYPGGCFGLNFEGSDNNLRKIFQSKYFRNVIVTQKITKDYLIDKNLCQEEKITYIYGGFVQFKRSEIKPKKYYRKDKNTFDICFVAAKYSEKGLDKGYDLFIETAKRLADMSKNMRFHVVGGFDKNDIDISRIESKITFYGYKQPDFLVDFYSNMDIFLSPNRPFKLFNGNFDGFPLGIDASYCGTALFVADELKMNDHYKPNQEIVIVPLDSKKIADKVFANYNDLKSFYKMSAKGQKITQQLFDMDYQVEERMKVFSKFVNLEIIEQ